MKRVIPIGDLLALYKRHPATKLLLAPILSRQLIEYSHRRYDGMGLLVREDVTDEQWQAIIAVIRDLHKIRKEDFRMLEHRHGWRIV